ncbi:MAG: M3 family metallopeptidase [Proteobacteria bacterium]|nr:M3 family metallopeptidase [Burkholderiales bacterium]
MQNPLLEQSPLPRFPDIRVEHVTPAIESLLAENRAEVARLAEDASTPTWQGFAHPLEGVSDRLRRAWGLVSHLNAVMNSPELREVYNENLSRVTAYYTEMGQNEALFAKYKALAASPGFSQLSAARRKVIENEVRDFRLSGAELPPAQKERYRQISERLAALSSRFSDNVLDATNAFSHHVDARAGLAGLPEDAIEAAAEAARSEGQTGYRFTLQAPSFQPVMQYADDRVLRETLYRAFVTRASEFGREDWDNSGLIVEILALRHELAQLLGFADFAGLSLAAKMAESPTQVDEFLGELAAKARPFALRDLAELQTFAREHLGLAELQAWDMMYASEKLRDERYAFSDNDVKQYFPETQVLPGMFRLVETIYGLMITEREAPKWHADVRFYEVANAAGEPIGHFYLDLYARASKRGGAWMDDAIARRRRASGLQLPVAYLTCNFPAPVTRPDGTVRPALFTHDDVVTLFHEFGHGLHHLLTEIDELFVSGINGVEWDAVELPSQFMENFCWEWDVLKHLTRHVDTGAPMPRALFDCMLAAKNFQSGLQTLRQVEFSLFDMRIHSGATASAGTSAQAVLDQVRREVSVLTPPEFNRFAHGFSHIFSGGYAAGYYSYKWAEVLSADAYSLFEERGVLNPEIGARFRDEVLARGGSRPALESFVKFRGREPRIDALLRHNGMSETAAA